MEHLNNRIGPQENPPQRAKLVNNFFKNLPPTIIEETSIDLRREELLINVGLVVEISDEKNSVKNEMVNDGARKKFVRREVGDQSDQIMSGHSASLFTPEEIIYDATLRACEYLNSHDLTNFLAYKTLFDPEIRSCQRFVDKWCALYTKIIEYEEEVSCVRLFSCFFKNKTKYEKHAPTAEFIRIFTRIGPINCPEVARAFDKEVNALIYRDTIEHAIDMYSVTSQI